MKKLRRQSKNINTFIIILSFIGLISGYNYYKYSDITEKEELKNTINIEENLKRRPKILRNIIDPIIILVSSILIIPSIINIIKIFYNPFTIGYLFALISSFNLKLSIYYNLIYQIIPNIFLLILIKTSIKITINIIKNLYKRTNIKKYIKKYILISIFYYIYIIIIYIFSININTNLLKFML